MPCPKKVQKRYTKRKIRTDRRRKHFFHTFLYLLGEWTNQRYVPRHSVVPKHQIVKLVLSVRRHYPKRGWFTAPNSPLQNHSNFGATRFSLATLHFIIFLFSDFNRMGPYAWRRIYTFCIWQPTSQYPFGSFLG